MSNFDPHMLEPFWESWYVESLIGEGSYGSVYKIYKEEFGRKYYSALKIISLPKTEGEEKEILSESTDMGTATQYFYEVAEVIYKEIQIMEELKGKTNIVSFEDHKIVPKDNGIGYYILIRMELLTCLNDYLLDTPVTTSMLLQLGKDLCTALELCQKRAIIHRDIKPANIFVSVDGDFKLGDFGIARQLEGIESGLSVKGTYAYMAPEVYRGQSYDERVDIYSLGMVMYYYLNNRRAPFMPTNSKALRFGQKQEALKRRFGGEKLLPPLHGSTQLKEVVLKACEFNPEDRYSSAAEFLEALEQITIEEDEVLVEAARLSGGTESGDQSVDGQGDSDESEPSSQQVQTLDGKEDSNQPKAEEGEATVYLPAGSSKSHRRPCAVVPPESEEHSAREAKEETGNPTETAPLEDDMATVMLQPDSKSRESGSLPTQNQTPANQAVITETMQEQQERVSEPDDMATVVLKPESLGEVQKPKAARKSHLLLFVVPAVIGVAAIAGTILWMNQPGAGEEPTIPTGSPQVVTPTDPVSEVTPSPTVETPTDGGDDSWGNTPSITPEVSPEMTPEEENEPVEPTSTPEVTKKPEKVKDYEVDLTGKKLKDYKKVKNLEKVTSLILANNRLNSTKELSKALELTYLDLQHNQIRDLSGLKNHKKLSCLNLTKNHVVSVKDLKDLRKLNILILSSNNITKIKELSKLTALTEIRLDGNKKLTDISILKNYKKLQIVDLSETSVKDISALYGLKDLVMVNLENTKVSREQINKLQKKIPNCVISR